MILQSWKSIIILWKISLKTLRKLYTRSYQLIKIFNMAKWRFKTYRFIVWENGEEWKQWNENNDEHS